MVRNKSIPFAVQDLCDAVEQAGGQADPVELEPWKWSVCITGPWSPHPVWVWYSAPRRTSSFFGFVVTMASDRDEFTYQGLSKTSDGLRRWVDIPEPFSADDPAGENLSYL